MTALQIRNLSDDVHRKLKARAAERGQSLSEYATQVLTLEVSSPSPQEWRERVRAREQAGTAPVDDVVAIIRGDRDSR